MAETTLTFRFQEDGAGKVKGAVEGIGKATEKVGESAKKGSKEGEQAMGALEKRVMSMAERWGIYHDSVKRASGGMSGLTGKFSGVMDSLGGVSGLLKGAGVAAGAAVVGIGAMGAAAVSAAQGVLSLADAGGKVASVAGAFKELGGTKEELEGLREAVGGTVNDLDLQKIANTSKLFGIAGDEFKELTKLAMGASRALGTDMGKALEDVMTASARQSVQILDNLGIQMGALGPVYEAYAKKAGVAVDELTAKQKQHAFIQRAIEMGANQIAMAEGAKNNALAKSTATLENMKNEFLAFFAGVVDSSGVLDTLTDTLGVVSEVFAENQGEIQRFIEMGLDVLIESFRAVGAAILPSLPHVMSLVETLAGAAPAFTLVVGAMGKFFSISLAMVDMALRPLVAILGKFIEGAGMAASALGLDVGKRLEAAGKNMVKFSVRLDDTRKKFEEQSKAAKESAKAIEDIGEKASASALKIEDLADKSRTLNKEIDEEKLQAFADGLDLGRVVDDVPERIELSYTKGMNVIGEFENRFGKLKDVIGSSTPQFDATMNAGELLGVALERTGGRATEAANLVRRYVDTLEAAGAATRNVTHRTNQEAAQFSNMISGLRQAIDTWENGGGDGGDDGKGKQRAAARRKLIYEASLVGLPEIQRQAIETQKQLQENLKVAGRNAEAIAAAHKIAGVKVGKLLAESIAVSGIAAANGMARNFEITMERWADQRARDLMHKIFRREFAVEAIGRALEGVNMAAYVFGHKFMTESNIALAMFAEGIPGMLEPLGEKIAATRMEAEGLISAFDGEATNLAMEGLFNFANGTQIVAESVSANIGMIGEAFRDLADAADLTDTSAATEASFAALGKAASGSVAIGKAAAGAFIKDKKKLAGVLGGFEIAEAVAAAARLDFLGAAAHTLASIKYFAVAGGGAGSAGGSSATRQRAQRRTQLSGGNAVLDRRATQTQTVNNYFFSALDQRPSGEAVMDALGQAARGNTAGRIPARLVSDGNIQRGL